jgi:hypothetical protein
MCLFSNDVDGSDGGRTSAESRPAAIEFHNNQSIAYTCTDIHVHDDSLGGGPELT